MSITIFKLLIVSNILLLGLCGYLLYDRWRMVKYTEEVARKHGRDIADWILKMAKQTKANADLRKLLEYKKETPSDCKEGRWCGACQFGKLMMVYSDYNSEEAYYYCTKAQCCDFWTERKGFDDD